MAVQTEGKHLGDWLKFEEDNHYSREEVTVLAGAGGDRVLKTGMVLGRITASGKVAQVDFAGVDGREAAYGILLLDVTAPDGVDAEGVAIVRHAVVSDNGLRWPAGATVEQKGAAIAQLKAAGILVREGA